MGKPIRTKTLISALIGFCGIAIALKPDNGVFQWVALCGLLAGFGNAASQVCLHKTSQQQSPLENMSSVYFWSSYFLVLPLLYALFFTKIHFSWHNSLIIIFIAITAISLTNQTIHGVVYKWVRNPATIFPLLYLSIPFAGVFDWLIYHEVPTWNKIVGAVVVIISVSVISIHPKEKSKWKTQLYSLLILLTTL